MTTSAIWTVFCDGEDCWCDDARDRSTRQVANASARAAGWRVIGDRALCPACLRKVQQADEATSDPSASGYGGTTYRAGLLTFAKPRGPE